MGRRLAKSDMLPDAHGMHDRDPELPLIAAVRGTVRARGDHAGLSRPLPGQMPTKYFDAATVPLK